MKAEIRMSIITWFLLEMCVHPSSQDLTVWESFYVVNMLFSVCFISVV